MERLRDSLTQRRSMPIDAAVHSVVDELLSACDGMAEDDIVLMGVEF